MEHTRRFILRTIGWGSLLFILAMVSLVVMSFVFGTEEPLDYPAAVIGVALIEGALAYWFAKRIKPATPGEAVCYGLAWAGVVAGILLLITVPNGTTGVIFGTWPFYLVFVAITAGAWLVKRK